MSFRAGSAGAGSALQQLDVELADLRHKREGIRLSLENLENKMAPLHMRTRELAIAADEERQAREVQDLSRTAERLTGEIIDHWRRGCTPVTN